MRRLIPAVLLLFLAACGHDPVRGTVVDHRTEPETVTEVLLPIKTSEVCSGSGYTRTCVPIYTYIPYQVTDDADWILVVKVMDPEVLGRFKRVEVNVTQAEYESHPIGSEWDGFSRDDPDQKVRKS